MIGDISNGKDRPSRNPQLPPEYVGICLVEQCRENNGFKGQAFIASLLVETSNIETVRKGEVYDWYVGLATPQRQEFAAPELKQFVQSVMKAKTQEEKAKLDMKDASGQAHITKLLNAACSDAQVFKGKGLRVNTKASASGFTKHFFAVIA